MQNFLTYPKKPFQLEFLSVGPDLSDDEVLLKFVSELVHIGMNISISTFDFKLKFYYPDSSECVIIERGEIRYCLLEYYLNSNFVSKELKTKIREVINSSRSNLVHGFTCVFEESESSSRNFVNLALLITDNKSKEKKKLEMCIDLNSSTLILNHFYIEFNNLYWLEGFGTCLMHLILTIVIDNQLKFEIDDVSSSFYQYVIDANILTEEDRGLSITSEINLRIAQQCLQFRMDKYETNLYQHQQLKI